MEKGHEIWCLEYKEPVEVTFIYNSTQGITKVQIRFSWCAGG